jgi:hypothetical protein
MSGAFRHIHELLQKTLARFEASTVRAETIQRILEDEFHTPFNKKDIVLRDKELRIKAHPLIKNEIMLRRVKLLERFARECGAGTIVSVH